MDKVDKEKNGPSKSLEFSIQSGDLGQLSGDISEAVIDSILKDGLLKEIPIIGTVVGLFKVGISFRDRNYLKKIYKFLFELKDISQKDREEFSKSISASSKKVNDFFEKLLYLIDRLDDIEKAEIVGKLFSSLIKEKIKVDDFLRIASMIDKAFIGDLKYLDFRYGDDKKMTKEERLQYFRNIDESLIKTSLINEGLLDLEEIPRQTTHGGSTKPTKRYKLSKMGDLLIKFGF